MIEQADEAQLDTFQHRVDEHGRVRSILESFAYIKPFGGMFGKIVPFYAESYWYAMGGLTFLMRSLLVAHQFFWPVPQVVSLLERARLLFLRAAAPVSGVGYRVLPRTPHTQLVDWPDHLYDGHGREPLRPARARGLGVPVRLDALRRYVVRAAVLLQSVQYRELHR